MKKIPSILLVDDDETTNYINKLTITKANLTDELLIALNGRDALDLIAKRFHQTEKEHTAFLPDLIFLDINMPVMDGFKFLENLQTIDGYTREAVVVAILTTSLDPRDVEKVQKLGVNEFISKPLTKASLENLVAKHFN